MWLEPSDRVPNVDFKLNSEYNKIRRYILGHILFAVTDISVQFILTISISFEFINLWAEGAVYYYFVDHISIQERFQYFTMPFNARLFHRQPTILLKYPSLLYIFSILQYY